MCTTSCVLSSTVATLCQWTHNSTPPHLSTRVHSMLHTYVSANNKGVNNSWKHLKLLLSIENCKHCKQWRHLGWEGTTTADLTSVSVACFLKINFAESHCVGNLETTGHSCTSHMHLQYKSLCKENWSCGMQVVIGMTIQYHYFTITTNSRSLWSI